MRRLLSMSCLAALLVACPSTPDATRAAEPAGPADEPREPEPVAHEATPHVEPPGAGIVFVAATEDDVAAQVAALVTRARAEGRAPLVYVGATWCEPCQYFHAAALRGELDDSLPPLILLEFDRDRDGARLDAAGYASRMIPLFVVPDADGGPTDARIEGSIHGPHSPAQIVPRLRDILPPS